MIFYGQCPLCRKFIQLVSRKDFESFTNNDIILHAKREHPTEYVNWIMTHPFGFPFTEIKLDDEITEDEIYKKGDKVGDSGNTLVEQLA